MSTWYLQPAWLSVFLFISLLHAASTILQLACPAVLSCFVSFLETLIKKNSSNFLLCLFLKFFTKETKNSKRDPNFPGNAMNNNSVSHAYKMKRKHHICITCTEFIPLLQRKTSCNISINVQILVNVILYNCIDRKSTLSVEVL